MSAEELYNEYSRDLDELNAKVMDADSSDDTERYLKKNKKLPNFTITRKARSKKGNRYLMFITYERDGKDWKLSAFYVGLMLTTKGTAAVIFYETNQRAVIFTPHFFNRYKERFAPTADWRTRDTLLRAKTIEEIIQIFIKRNMSVVWIETPSRYDDKVHLFAPLNDGVGLVQWSKSEKVLKTNTFISFDMLSPQQQQMVQYANSYITMSDSERKSVSQPDFT